MSFWKIVSVGGFVRLRHYTRPQRPLIQILMLGVLLVFVWGNMGRAANSTLDAITIAVDNISIGKSTQYIGACEGNVNFEGADLADLGINTYRIYGGMSRWESDDDDGRYGWPTIAQIKQNPDIIAWERWDEVMMHPKTGTDYAFSGTPATLWQGSAETIFRTLQQGQIRPVLTIRSTDSDQNPDWASQLNPPLTEEAWNEWWEHVFATVYWLNVRNNYQVDDFEIANEPDNHQQGWDGNQGDYFRLLQVAYDAISYVYATYLPDRNFYIHGPTTTGGSNWPRATLETVPTYFNSVNVHDYSWNVADYVQQVRRWMQGTIHAKSPLWLGEWGTYTGDYDDLTVALNLIKNMIRMSQPGKTYVYGSHLFSLYDWGLGDGFEGLINDKGERRLSYYAFRMGIHALQGGRSVLNITGDPSDITSIATQDWDGTLSLLFVNDRPENQQISLDVSSILNRGSGTVSEFSAVAKDQVVVNLSVEDGLMMLELPGYTSHLIDFSAESQRH